MSLTNEGFPNQINWRAELSPFSRRLPKIAQPTIYNLQQQRQEEQLE